MARGPYWIMLMRRMLATMKAEILRRAIALANAAAIDLGQQQGLLNGRHKAYF